MRLAVGIVVATMVLGGLVAAQGAGKLVRLTGIIVDDQCRKANERDDERPCDMETIADDARLVFLDSKGEVHLIEDQEEALAHVGREITVFGLQRADSQLWLLDVTRYIDPVGDALAKKSQAQADRAETTTRLKPVARPVPEPEEK
ncbi:MAG: hypothetical protein OEV00_12685 [Acidobacteriota bacterium]|nr:hypothetical protein [Acidobacteriota bacterium]